MSDSVLPIGPGKGMQERKISPDLLASRLWYEPESGLLYWRNGRHKGKVAGSLENTGYYRIRLKEGIIMAHRAAWALMMGEWPSGEIDHINRDRGDNRWSNLREANRLIQCRNSKSDGVCYCSQTGKWKAYLTIDRKQVWLGRHATKELALNARKRAIEKYWGEAA